VGRSQSKKHILDEIAKNMLKTNKKELYFKERKMEKIGYSLNC